MDDAAFQYDRGDEILVRSVGKGVALLSGTITGRYHELGRKVYDYIDHFGSPRWCAEEDVCMLCTRHRSD